MADHGQHGWTTSKLGRGDPKRSVRTPAKTVASGVSSQVNLHSVDDTSRYSSIHGNVLSWITDFLSDRSQFVSINDFCSSTIKVTSGVPQGSVLGPSLFIYFINDLPSVCTTLTKIFADDTKVYTHVSSPQDCTNLQNTLNSLTDWSDKWLLKFNSEKCCVLHLGKDNTKHDYFMKEGDQVNILTKTTCEKDLGVYVDCDLKFNVHIKNQVKKARSIAGVINSNIINKTSNVMIPLFKSMIRPILEYANSVWSPYLFQDIKTIENIQRTFTKKIHGMNNKKYSERLKLLNLPSLEFRRLRGDLIEVFKIIHCFYDPATTNNLFLTTPPPEKETTSTY